MQDPPIATQCPPNAGISPTSYGRLPEHFFARLAPTPVAGPRLIHINRPLAAEIGLNLDGLGADALAAMFCGNLLPSAVEPIALAYAGHQFGHFVPQLGDGRAILLGEVRDRGGRRFDIQLKGSGRTPYSRSGDGRAALGPVLREYIVSEAMHALGVPTTRALAAVATGEQVLRERVLPGAILTRVAASHVRVGTFEYFAARADLPATRLLADYVIERHYPGAGESANPYLSLLQAVAERQAKLIAAWMLIGFVHGVMNTDNMAISGETIDFGPCAFLDAYDPAAVFSSIDGAGRYAYANQAAAAAWNLARFAETLVPLLDANPERAVDLANGALGRFQPSFQAHWLAGMRRKLGLSTAEDGDAELARGWLEALHRNGADFTLSFRRLADAAEREPNDGREANDQSVPALGADRVANAEWSRGWRSRLSRELVAPAARAAAMRRVNPAYIPRNHLIERALGAAVEHEDFAIFEQLLGVLSHPFDEQRGCADYAQPPLPHERVLRTFCGT